MEQNFNNGQPVPRMTGRVVKIELTDERAKQMFTRSDGTLAGAVRIH
jgi:hypothetical protein